MREFQHTLLCFHITSITYSFGVTYITLDFECANDMSSSYYWESTKIAARTQQVRDMNSDIHTAVWKLLSSRNEATRLKATQIVCIFITSYQEYRSNVQDIEILATLCSGDTCLKVCSV